MLKHITKDNMKKNVMKPSARLYEMQEVQKKARDFIALGSISRPLLQKRLFAENKEHYAKPSVRLYFIEKLHQHLAGVSLEETWNNDEAMKVGMVGEYCITIMYLDNHLQDGKYGVVNEKAIKLNKMERTATKADLDHYIQTQFKGYKQERINQTVSNLFYLYHKGMELDKEALTYENMLSNNPENLHLMDSEIDSYVNVEFFLSIFSGYKSQKYELPIKENYFKLLLTRAYLINAVFFQVFAELMIDLYIHNQKEKKEKKDYNYLIEFARVFGLAQQLVNDNCDYLPISYEYTTLCKLPEDTFSDLRRGLITLPILRFFEDSNAHKGDLFELYANNSNYLMTKGNNQEVVDDNQKWLLFQLKESKALGRSMGYICALANHGEKLINDDIFKDMFSFVRANRFYQAYSGFQYS